MNPDIAQTSRLLGFTQATEVKMAMGKQPKVSKYSLYVYNIIYVVHFIIYI